MLNYIKSFDHYLPFKLRLILVLAFFSTMGIVDYKKNPNDPKRLKEYIFVLSLVAGSIIYGVAHDIVTFNISREYFEYGKQLGVGVEFYPKVLFLAINASYTVGLFVGLAFVFANNPSKKHPQLNYKQLTRHLVYPLGYALGTAIFLGSLSNIFYPIFSIYFRAKLSSPLSFERVAFIHWGTYIGSLIGLIVGVFKIRKSRADQFRNTNEI